jgi:2,3,4,5-tetrahydropyridine-2-carboxylate N-succinyltransferase
VRAGVGAPRPGGLSASGTRALRAAVGQAAPHGIGGSAIISVVEIAERIDELWETGEVDAAPIEEAIALLDRGTIRVAEPTGDEWVVHEWVKKAILLYFRLRKVEPMEVGGLQFLDKIPVKSDYAERGVRVVPPGVARYGSFLSEGVVLMPGYVNIGAWVGPGTMVDTWATVGSCAQIGADVHLAGGVGIGGVLEPPQAAPVIVEDGAFIGSRAVIVEGVRIGEGAVIAPNVVLSASVPVIDVTGPEPVEYRGVVPPRKVVLPGVRDKHYPSGTYGLPCALIVGERSASTDRKTSLNDVLREFEIAV